MRRFAAIIACMLLADILSWWLSARWLRKRRTRPWLRWVCHAFYAVQAAYVALVFGSMLTGSFSIRRGFDWVPRSVEALLFVWHLAILPLTLLMWAGVGALAMGRRLLTARRPQAESAMAPASADPASEDGLSRRDFLAASVAIVPPLLALGAVGYGLPQTSRFRLNRMVIPVANLPGGLDGFTIAHVSDLHVGRWSSDEFLREVVEVTNSLNADVVLFTGDLIDISTLQLPRAIEVARQWRARHGMVMIEGNHDLIESPSTFHHAIQQSGMRFLRGESLILDHKGTPVQLLGAPWSRGSEQMQRDLDVILQQRDPAAFPILMAHHPHYFDPAAAAGLPLTLSGHTHGGQLALSRELNAGELMFRYISGLYQKGDSRLLVSNGTGNWFPLRINAPAEIIHITLTPA